LTFRLCTEFQQTIWFRRRSNRSLRQAFSNQFKKGEKFMSMFDSIINEADEKFNLGAKAGTVLSALLALMTDKNSGGFAGFLERFNRAGLGDTVTSWIGSGSNMPVSNEQLESALGEDALKNIADQTGTDYGSATSATAFLIPRVVDALTPEGEIPQDGDLLSRIGGYLNGGAASGSINAVGNTAGAVSDRFGNAPHSVGETVDGNDGDDSILKWLLPLLLLGLLLFLGYTFCGKSTPVVTTNANVNTNAVNR